MVVPVRSLGPQPRLRAGFGAVPVGSSGFKLNHSPVKRIAETGEADQACRNSLAGKALVETAVMQAFRNFADEPVGGDPVLGGDRLVEAPQSEVPGPCDTQEPAMLFFAHAVVEPVGFRAVRPFAATLQAHRQQGLPRGGVAFKPSANLSVIPRGRYLDRRSSRLPWRLVPTNGTSGSSPPHPPIARRNRANRFEGSQRMKKAGSPSALSSASKSS